MRFSRLYLKAFGPFQERWLDLAAPAGPDLHLMFGPNEAGKSTLLRAIRDFLFGIPERTGDAFLHDYPALRVGATLQLPDGSRWSAMRRKGRKATLFALDEQTGAELTERPLAEETIAKLLAGLDQALYQNLFGLDLNGLVVGSEELLRGEGEVGRSLFQAAAGLGSLNALGNGLEADALHLFKPRGSTGRLNLALREFDEQRKCLKQVTVRSAAWETAAHELRAAEARWQQLQTTYKERRSEQQRLERLRTNLPLLAERAVKLAELSSLAQVPILGPDAAQERATIQERLRATEAARALAQQRLEALGAALGRAQVRHDVLLRGDAIERAYRGIAAYQTARAALPGITAERQLQNERIAQLLAAIAPAESVERAAALLPTETLVTRVGVLIEVQDRLASRAEQLEDQIREKEAALTRLRAQLAERPEPGPTEALETALASAGHLAELENRTQKLAARVAEEECRLRQEVAALWPGPVEDFIALGVPLPATATDFEEEFALLVQQERSAVERLASLQRDLGDRQRELEALAATGEVVTQAEVAAARAQRDAQWSTFRETCLTPPTGPERDSLMPLAQAVEAAIGEADRLADLLHADAQRATELAITRQRIAEMQAAIRAIEQEQIRLAEVRHGVQQRWDALLSPLCRPELSPKSLRDWLAQRQRVLDRNLGLAGLRREYEAVITEFAEARRVLEQGLLAGGLDAWDGPESAASALNRARLALAAARSARAARESILVEIKTAESDVQDLRAQRQLIATRLGEWTRDWEIALKGLRLAANALPAEAKTRLEQLDRLARALTDLRRLDAAAEAQRSTMAAFEKAVAGIVHELMPELAESDAIARAERLYTALRCARETERESRRLESEIETQRRELAALELTLKQAAQQLAELLREARCRSAEELPAIEEQSARKQRLQQRLQEIDEQLLSLNAQPVETVIREADGFDLDGIARQSLDLAAAIEALEEELEPAQRACFEARQRFAAIDGGSAAADAQQALAAASARIVEEARAYARIRLAGAVLHRVVQAYRDRHQGPLLRRAAAVFARITLGSFAGLTVDHVDARQVLLGVRPDRSRVAIAGMSQGTRDQLFLALRLAAIEQHLASRGPLPVVIDDLLVQFDDERALATLEVLIELSASTQILFFTHHRHLVDLAQANGPTREITVHRL